MKYDYDIEIKNILNKIYEHKIYAIAAKNDSLDIDINLFKSTNIYLGSDMNDFIINFIPKGKDGYYFRCMIANHRNYSYPRLYDYKGNPLKSISSNKVALQLWEDHVNDMLIEDISRRFSVKDFHRFIDDNLGSMSNSISKYIEDYKVKNTITIPFTDKNQLLLIIKDMLINNKLNISWAEVFVDIDQIRQEMTEFSVAFNYYNEFDRLEDDLEYCLDKFCKFSSSEEIYNILVNEMNFKYVDNLGLVRE